MGGSVVKKLVLLLDTKRSSADASGAMTTKFIYLSLSREGRHLLTRQMMFETSSHLDLRTQCGFYFPHFGSRSGPS